MKKFISAVAILLFFSSTVSAEALESDQVILNERVAHLSKNLPIMVNDELNWIGLMSAGSSVYYKYALNDKGQENLESMPDGKKYYAEIFTGMIENQCDNFLLDLGFIININYVDKNNKHIYGEIINKDQCVEAGE